MGKPIKYPGGPATTLNRAKRSAPQIGKIAVTIHVSAGLITLGSLKATTYIMKAGATPNEMTSDKESNSLPNSL
ncbi:hypothetical protein D3C71_1993320 [compost metagenome]